MAVNIYIDHDKQIFQTQEWEDIIKTDTFFLEYDMEWNYLLYSYRMALLRGEDMNIIISNRDLEERFFTQFPMPGKIINIGEN